MVAETVIEWLGDVANNFAAFDVPINAQSFDVIGHRNDDGLLIVEFEIIDRGTVSYKPSFATLVHRAMERFKRQTDIDTLLGMVAADVRKITGFDRVMVYRFRYDDSGEVVRESRREGLDNWEGHRYPSSDIPASGSPTLHPEHAPLDRACRIGACSCRLDNRAIRFTP